MSEAFFLVWLLQLVKGVLLASGRRRLERNQTTPLWTKTIYPKMSVVLGKACQQMPLEDATEAV